MKGLIEGDLSLSLSLQIHGQNPNFLSLNSLNSWPKTQLSHSLNFGQKLNPPSLNPWPKTQLSLSLSLSLNLWLFVVSDLGFCSLIWDLSFVFGFSESLR